MSLQKAEGRISFTSDLWSDPKLRPFLALTAHWLARETANSSLVLKGTLIAFHYMPGSHAGKALGSTIFNLIKRAGVTHNVSVYLRCLTCSDSV
jgi:hypothetical protein